MTALPPSHRGAPRSRGRRVRTWWGVAGALLLAGVLLVWVVPAGMRHVAQGRIEAAQERIRAAGSPVLPADIEYEEVGEGDDVREWLRELAGHLGAGVHGSREEITDPYGLDAVLLEAREAGIDARRLATLEALRECLGEEVVSIHDPPTTTADDRAAYEVRLLEAVEAGSWIRPDLLESLLRCGPIDQRAMMEEWAAGSPPGQTNPLVDLMGALMRLPEIAWSAGRLARRGEVGEAVQRMHVALHGAEIVAGIPSLMGHLVWTPTLTANAEQVPLLLEAGVPDEELRRIEERLAGLEPRANLLWNLAAERTLLNLAYAWGLEHGQMAEPGFGPGLGGDFSALDLDDYRLCLKTLEGYERAIELVRAASADFLRLRDAGRHVVRLRGLRYLPRVLRSLLGDSGPGPTDFSRLVDTSLTVEAQLLLARAATVFHLEGEEALVRWLTTHPDPFDGRPLRTRIDPDGTLVLWSVGEDGTDEGGSEHVIPSEDPTDIVLRVAR